jgi:integrase
VPLQSEIYDQLDKLRGEGRFIVPSRIDDSKELAAHKDSDHYQYRCGRAHEKLIKWLRWLGVDDPKPSHRLRKEFGSHVATTMSLFYAQKYLGHSSPEVTSRHYAGLTNLPVPSNYKPTKA